MLPSQSCDPDINVVVLGAKLIKRLASTETNVEWLLEEFPSELGVSVDHVILCVDWLYMIDAIYIDGERICVYEAD
ncbi:ABC-three component system middle component 6 [Pseudomonas sp. 13B_2.1_Bac1]|uniref:ABC-three component system middle component 6 n=1 Tax=Pseudomonas sp. 13B_2.1_Bac1 TaxID=2971624 RepID=UPI003965BDC8